MEYRRAQIKLRCNIVKDIDILIFTAFKHGENAPKLIAVDMVKSTNPEVSPSFLLLRAAETLRQLFMARNKSHERSVKCVNYIGLMSHFVSLSFTLYFNKSTQFFHNMGPECTKTRRIFFMDHNDYSASGALIIQNVKLTCPAPTPLLLTLSNPTKETRVISDYSFSVSTCFA